MPSTRVFRWILVGLSLALAVLLIARGNVVIGVLIAAMAVTRAVMFVRMHQERRRVHDRLVARRERYRAGLG